LYSVILKKGDTLSLCVLALLLLLRSGKRGNPSQLDGNGQTKKMGSFGPEIHPTCRVAKKHNGQEVEKWMKMK